jgi:hypothetical protein
LKNQLADVIGTPVRHVLSSPVAKTTISPTIQDTPFFILAKSNGTIWNEHMVNYVNDTVIERPVGF